MYSVTVVYIPGEYEASYEVNTVKLMSSTEITTFRKNEDREAFPVLVINLDKIYSFTIVELE